MSPCLSDLRLDELLAGELDGDDRAVTDEHLLGCTSCRDRHELLAADRERFRAAMPRLRPRRTRWIAQVPALAVVAAALALVVRAPEDGTRTKGGPHLGIIVTRDETMWTGGPGEKVRAGDTLSFLVTTSHSGYVTIVGDDGTVYVAAEWVEAGRDRQLSVALRLDAARGPARLRAYFCEAPGPVHDCPIDELPLEKLP